MPNGQNDSNGIDMDAFNQSIGKAPTTSAAPKQKIASTVKQQPKQELGEQNGIDMDAFSESLKKKDGTSDSTNGSQATPSVFKNADNKVDVDTPPPTQEEQTKAAL